MTGRWNARLGNLWGGFRVGSNKALPLGARVRIVEGECEDMLATITQQSGGKIAAKLQGTNIYKKLYAGNVRAA